MNWLIAAVVALSFSGLGYIVVRLTHGRSAGITPLGAFLTAWILAVFLYVANPFGLYRLGALGTLVVALGIGSFVAAYSSVALFTNSRAGRTGVSDPLHHKTQVEVTASLWKWCRRLWVPLFALFLVQIHAYSASSITSLLARLRVNLSAGSAPLGFYFFYLAQISVPLGAVLFLETRERKYAWWTLIATIALLFTSGRTNILIALASVVFILILWGRLRVTRRRIGAVLLSLIAALWLFNYVGNGIGKTYENSQLYGTFGNSPPVPTFLVQPLFYLGGPLPYLGDLVRTAPVNGSDHGSNIARPFLQGAAIVLPIKAPTKIQEFRSIPFPTNLGTYMSPLYRDFGVIGVVLGSALFGALSATAWAAWRRRNSPLSLTVVGVVLVFCAGSILDAGYTELWFVLFLALVGLSSRSARRRALKAGKRTDSDQRSARPARQSVKNSAS